MMARRKPAPPLGGRDILADFPSSLLAEHARLGDFVGEGEQPEPWRGITGRAELVWWRQYEALLRWQSAVRQWGEQRGLTMHELRALNVWPTRPPRP